MGGDSFFPSIIPTEDDESLLGIHYQPQSFNSPLDSCDDGLSTELDIGQVDNGGSGLTCGGIQGSDPPKSLLHEAAERQRNKVYAQIWKSYDNVQDKIEGLEEARTKILSYTPGSWAENANGRDWDERDVPNTTSLLLIGPKASGKSSLVNKISQVLEDGLFTSARAQVSNSTLTEDGTYFSYQYMIPRSSGSFCLCDTRGLSNDTFENLKMLKHWRKKGVRHGELVKRESDSDDLKAQLKCKAKGLHSSSQRIRINFVIFVVNGLSVLEAMDGDDGRKREFCQQIATIFNDPLLSFKDDKPVVVVTHGDLLSLSDRVRIRFYLGELLCIPPAQQIFDIPESNDTASKLTILDMLFYCLEHADRNLPIKKQQADRNLYVKRLAKAQIKEPWWAFSLAVLLPILVLALSFVYQLPVNGSQSQGVQGCYARSPTRESQGNGVQDSYHHHAPENQSQEDSAQTSHPHEFTDASEKIGIQACLSCEPTVASPMNPPTVNSSNPDSLPTEKGAQENGLPTSTPLILSDKSHKDDIQASQTYPTTDRAQENDFPASRRHVPSDEPQKNGVQKEPVQASQPQAPSNAPKKNGAQASQAHVRAKKSSKNLDDKVDWHKIRHFWSGDDDHHAPDKTKDTKVEWHKIRKENGAQASQAHVRTKKSSKDTEDKVEWHKIRHFWSGDDDLHAPDKTKDTKVEWHKIRHLWSS